MKRIAAPLKKKKKQSKKAPASAARKRAAASSTAKTAGSNPSRVRAILKKLDEAYPEANCELKHENGFQLLVSTILSAQCTDARVNQVTPALFQAYPTPEAMAHANPADIETAIRSTGFFRSKTKSIQGASKKILTDFSGEVPRTMDQLLSLPGVARKTANVVLGTAFGVARGIVVDTHVLRLSKRLDLTRHTDPKKVEQDLMRIIPYEKWILISHQLIWHGRRVCRARQPRCVECNLEHLCYARDKTI